MAPDPSAPPWTTCTSCGGAVPPSAASCPSCGSAQPTVRSGEIPRLPSRLRRKVRLLQAIRAVIVIGVAVGIAYAVASAVWSGPPTYPDPLTTRGTLPVGAGNFSYLSGAITGEDYIVGNFTVVYPVGVPISFSVYNASEFTDFAQHRGATPLWSTANESSSRIVFAAPYTDTFFLVFQNPYPPGSGINVLVYEVTNYQTNVVIG